MLSIAACRLFLVEDAKVNPSETNNLVSVLIITGGPIVARWGVDANTWGAAVQAGAAAIPAIGGALWLVYSHWNMKKVPENAHVVPAPVAANHTAA
jgi:hypothetical protein